MLTLMPNHLSGEREEFPALSPMDVQSNNAAELEPAGPSRLVFWLALVLPLACLAGGWTSPAIYTPMELKGAVSQIYLSALLLAWFLVSGRKRDVFTLDFSGPVVFFAALFLYGTLSVAWSANADFWVFKWFRWYAGFIMFFLGLQVVQNRPNLDWIVNCGIVAGLVTASIGIAQYLFGFDIVPQASAPSSTFGNVNMAGQIMVLTLPLPLYFLFRDSLSVPKTWAYAFALSLLALFAFYTRTRAVWLASGLEAALLLAFILFDKRRRPGWLFLNRVKIIAIVSASLFFLLMTNMNRGGFQPFWEIAVYEMSSIMTDVGNDESPRYLIWSAGLDIFRDHPVIGSGLGNFYQQVNTSEYLDYSIMGIQRVHNDVLELGIELGVIGWIFLLGIIVSMCVLLYRLMLYSQGEQRLLFAVLTIAVTGSMLNAQVSFPYQLPVPLLFMPLYVALVIQGARLLGGKARAVTLGGWFRQAAIPVLAVILALNTLVNLTWLYDFHQLDRIVLKKTNAITWEPVSPVWSQAHILVAKRASDSLIAIGDNQASLNVIQPILGYWPDSAATITHAVENTLGLGRFEEAEQWSRKLMEALPPDTFLGEYYLVNIYGSSGDMVRYRELYEALASQPESALSRYRHTYSMLHNMAAFLGDQERVGLFYDRFTKYHGMDPYVENTQAVYSVKVGDTAAAVHHMKQVLALTPNTPLASDFRAYIELYGQ